MSKNMKSRNIIVQQCRIFQTIKKNNLCIIIFLKYRKTNNQAYCVLFQIIFSAKYLARQELAIRDTVSQLGQKLRLAEVDSLIIIREENCDGLSSQLINHKTFTRSEIQNKLLHLIAHSVLRESVRQMFEFEEFATILIGDAHDSSHCQQKSICKRYVDETLQPQEKFVRLCNLEKLSEKLWLQ